VTCFGRSTETAELWRHFKAGRNLLMLAPRRIGKTVQINHLRDTAAEHGFRAIVLEVAGFREEKDFFRQCCATIQEELSTGAKVMTAFSEPVGEAALRHLLDTLLADGYLAVDHERRYAFRMNLLREWWLRYVVL